MAFNIVNEQSHIVKANMHYDWQQGIIVPIKWFDQVSYLEELFIQNDHHYQVVKLFKRI